MLFVFDRYGPKMVSEGRISGGDVVTVFFCIWSGSASIGNLTPSVHAIASARGAAVAIYDVIDSVSIYQNNRPGQVGMVFSPSCSTYHVLLARKALTWSMNIVLMRFLFSAVAMRIFPSYGQFASMASCSIIFVLIY